MKQIQNYYIIVLAILLTLVSFFGLLLYIVVFFVSWFLQRKGNRKVRIKNLFSFVQYMYLHTMYLHFAGKKGFRSVARRDTPFRRTQALSQTVVGTY